ncbi:hypothetical protein HHK36_019055 [Tetracentron sinense]|uniref:Uncharacterized protein n=1 Tax=Tetracentron sinense TaxID=13715 RepID=A0A834YTD0_TETSI|nr:hypothetical protein HHK36_019055 [Tetracentron sinense]
MVGGIFKFNTEYEDEPFLGEKDPKAMEVLFLLRSTLEFPDGCQIPTSEDHELPRPDEEQHQEEEKKEEKCKVVDSFVELKMLTLSEFKVDHDEDGFRTPTYLDNKIQVKQCPPAPRKPKSLSSMKRTASSNLPQQIRIDLKDIASLFGHKFKRVRGSDDDMK